MSATSKQQQLIERLMDAGAPIPSDDDGDLDWSMYNSVQEADKYIKANLHYLRGTTTTLSPSEWGGIPNH